MPGENLSKQVERQFEFPHYTGDSIMYPQPVNDLSGWEVTS